MNATDRYLRPAIGVLALFAGAYFFTKLLHQDRIKHIIDDLLPKGEAVKNISLLAKGTFNSITRVDTTNNRYVIRIPHQVNPSSHYFERLRIISQLASENEFGPLLINSNPSTQSLLLEYVPNIPWPSYKVDPGPYFEAMKTLRLFHNCMKPKIAPGEKKDYSPFSFFLDNRLEIHKEILKKLPSHFSEANNRMQQIFERVKSWLVEHATFCHGDLHENNVLLKNTHNQYKTIFIDFDTTTVGHPFFDVAKFAHFKSEDFQQTLLKTYLDRDPTTTEKTHFKYMQLAVLMVMTTNRLLTAIKMKGSTSEKMSKTEMESILNSSNPIFYASYTNPKPRDRQMQALVTLREFLKESETILWTEEL